MRRTIWSVEVESNSFNDDLFTGTFEKCVKYCKDNELVVNGRFCQLAKIVEEDGIVVDCLEIVTEL